MVVAEDPLYYRGYYSPGYYGPGYYGSGYYGSGYNGGYPADDSRSSLEC